ncbi:MAG: PTS sugar transporter subunit IIC [Anaeromyxobacter sp.]
MLGIPLEFFWLGAVNLGAAVPAHEAAGTCAIVGGAILAAQNLGVPVGLDVGVLAFLVAAPVALVGRKADRIVEGWNERIALIAESALAHHHPHRAVRANLLGLGLPFLIGAVLAPLGAAVAAAVIPAVLRTWPTLSVPLAAGFLVLAAVACASGAKALRARLAPRAYVTALAGGLVVGAAVRFMGGLP